MVSPGTELNGAYLGENFPTYPGYATVFEVDQIGESVEDVTVGEARLGFGTHQSHQQQRASFTLPLPQDLNPSIAAIARLMAVTMTTLTTTRARPGDRVMVTGAGPVGHLGAQLFQGAGYDVSVVEPDAFRRSCALKAGVNQVFESVPYDNQDYARKVDLVLECSGHEQAVLDACHIIRPTGEIVLVGAPWRRRTEHFAHELLQLVFNNYITLRSGWEWQLPKHPGHFQAHGLIRNYTTAAKWLGEGRIYLDGLVKYVDPRDMQTVYQDHLHHRTDYLFTMIDWSLLE
ncbi:MAG: zinc-binding dehydrogenase [Chloroflexi bacterium]|nr:zinc-binding dehydrogenase [Chloroflexota bacterium]